MGDGMVDSMKNMAGMMSSDMMKKMDAMNKEMNAELVSLEGEEFDKHFLEMVIMHHQQAIEMSQIAQERASHSEVEDLAGEMIEEQTEEIEKMQSWQQEWGYTES